MDHDEHPTTDDGPGCAHSLCLFRSMCWLDELDVMIANRREELAQRRATGLAHAHALGLGADEGELISVICYSSDLSCRIAAGELLVAALQRLAEAAA